MVKCKCEDCQKDCICKECIRRRYCKISTRSNCSSIGGCGKFSPLEGSLNEYKMRGKDKK